MPGGEGEDGGTVVERRELNFLEPEAAVIVAFLMPAITAAK
jgi:hypothetical protein